VEKVVKVVHKAMTLEDHYALACLDAAYHHCRKTGQIKAESIAAYAWDLAEAMLEERSKRATECQTR